MRQFTAQERAFMVKCYIETRSYIQVRDRFQLQYPGINPPVKNTIKHNYDKFMAHATCWNRNEYNCGRHRTGRSPQNIADVQQALQQDPTGTSCRRNNLQIPRATFNRIVRLDLEWHPYKLQLRHELLAGDYYRRVRFSRWFLDKLRDNRFLANLVIGDEAGFAMNGRVSSQNVRCYAPKGEMPVFTYEVSSKKDKHTVWMGLCGNGTVLGPYFFDGNVTGETYLRMLNEEMFPDLVNAFIRQFNNNRFRYLWWAQDGAPPHTTVLVSTWMTEFFGDKVIALNHPNEWPPRSPDLTPCDFFLWGYMKSRVYVTPPRNMDDLRQRIINEAELIRQNPNLVKRAMRDMVRRARECVGNGGLHVRGTHG